MANPPIIDWALKNSSILNLSAIKLTWINEWLPGYFDYQITITVNAREHKGRGIDEDESIAFAKAIYEGLEHAAVAQLIHPWATAAYTDYKGACARASRELIGMDRVMCHHFCRKRSASLPIESLGKHIPLKSFLILLAKHYFKLTLCELRPTLDAKVVMAFVRTEDKDCKYKGLVAGCGCETTIEDAALHATIECLRTAVAVFIGRVEPEAWELMENPLNPRWHLWQLLREENKKFMESYILPTRECPSALECENISVSEILCKKIHSLESIFPDVPIVIVQAKSENLIIPKFGKFQPNDIALSRLRKFNGAPFKMESILPHFYC